MYRKTRKSPSARVSRVATATVAVAALVSVAGTASAAQSRADGSDVRAECEENTGAVCYTADQIRTAYGIDKLAAKGLTGKGRTIAVIDPVGAPNALKDLESYSTKMGLPKPDLKIVQHKPEEGKAAPFDWTDEGDVGAAQEVTMDLAAVHTVAPDAKIVLHQMNVAFDESGGDSLLDLVKALGDVYENNSADVVTMSLGLPEGGVNAAANKDLYTSAAPVFAAAAQEGITTVASSGDQGVFDPNGSADGKANVRTVDWPSSDPSVTAVGGTRITLDDQGKRTKADVVWNDEGASGGGPSMIFSRPGYQASGTAARAASNGHRAVPDISLTASPQAGMTVPFTDRDGTDWNSVGGTSLSAPLFAGMVALAAQQKGDSLGNVNPKLYALAATPEDGAKAGITDITSGVNGQDGYPAGLGYDMATGLGTVDASKLVPALAGKS
ncbi:S53 family peptidase [Actinomycetota bacterium Odt1-20B]